MIEEQTDKKIDKVDKKLITEISNMLKIQTEKLQAQEETIEKLQKQQGQVQNLVDIKHKEIEEQSNEIIALEEEA